MELTNVLFLDTETTGIPPRSANWETDFADYPHVVQIAWLHGCKVESHIIRPDGWEIPEESIAVHGITMEKALADGEPFAVVVDMLVADCHDAGLICGQNVHFDTGIIKANILRELGREYYDANDVENALFKGKRLDTMRATMKWVDARMANGRLKFPNLSELYARCFPGETFPAHDALEDCKAVARCLPVLLENGLLELKVKQYDETTQAPAPSVLKMDPLTQKMAEKFGQSPETVKNGPKIALNFQNDKLPIQQEKVAQNENSGKITPELRSLLEQNDF